MEVDFSEMGEDELESGGSCPPGWYRAAVAEVRDNQFSPGNVDVELHVTHGPWKGGRIFDTIVDPNNASDTDKAKKCKQRLAMWVTRSGMVTKDQLANQTVTLDFSELIGREVFVKMVEDNFTDKDGNKKNRCKPAFDGIFGLDDERVPDDVRKKAGVTTKAKPKAGGDAAPGQQPAQLPPKSPASPPAGKKKVDVSKL